ncbi:567_t:CDS:10 [Ambispora leptoticha]|uniref:Enhancer of mRNA-decapping protein 3 n=1 Tax=Ambispora leptoticha TaxID=144679 RepID=A0A9N8V688_9GLOM|nr:567_t:CDS:10 [Ambispora leptoticha]
MAEAFIGLDVHVVLSDNSWVEGTVSHINQDTQLLTLKNVTYNLNGHTLQQAIYGVAGANIKDLSILPTTRTSKPPPSQISAHTSELKNYAETKKLSNGVEIIQINNSNPLTAQNNGQSSKALPRSPFSDPAIISFLSTGFGSIVFSSTHQINIFINSVCPSTKQLLLSKDEQRSNEILPDNNYDVVQSVKTGSTGDSESKLDEEDERDSLKQYSINSKQHLSNGNHQNGRESSGFESDGTTPNHKKASKKKQSNNVNGYYHNSRESPARKNGRRRRHQIQHEWAGEDVNEFKSEEFDFQGNLDLFDKEKVFAEIRELDSTAPESLLVNINRNPNYNNRNGRYSAQAQQQKLASHENVLEPSNRKTNFYHTDEEDETANDGEVDSDDSWRKKNSINGTVPHRNARIRTLTGVLCPTVQPVQMVEVERIATTETGPNEDQMIENAGRGTAMMCLQALGGSRRIQPQNHNAAPLVVILAGNNKTGAYGIAAARHLANHGCHVITCVVGKERDLLKIVVLELPHQFTNPVDLIVDALLGYQFTLRDVPEEHERRLICELMEWANVNKAPVLSLDMPSGVNGNTGNPSNTAHYIHPKWTLCLGAPKAGCKSRSVTGELFLADIGIPRICWKKIGVKGWGMPWGSEYLIGLESNTLYAIQLRKAEVEISRLSIENIELRATIAQLNDQIDKLQCDKQNPAKSGQIADIINQLRTAADSLNSLGSRANSIAYQCITPAELDSWAEKIPDRKKPLKQYRTLTNKLSTIEDEPEETSFSKEDLIVDIDLLNNHANILDDESRAFQRNSILRRNTFQSRRKPSPPFIPNEMNSYQVNLNTPIQYSQQFEYNTSPRLSSIQQFKQFQDSARRHQSLHDQADSPELTESTSMESNNSPSLFSQSESATKNINMARKPLKIATNSYIRQESIINNASVSNNLIRKSTETMEDSRGTTKKTEEKSNLTDSNIGTSVSVSDNEPIRSRRKTQVSYVEPSLRSKLRQGDPFTSSFGWTESNSNKRSTRSKPKKHNTATKHRTALSNITNCNSFSFQLLSKYLRLILLN